MYEGELIKYKQPTIDKDNNGKEVLTPAGQYRHGYGTLITAEFKKDEEKWLNQEEFDGTWHNQKYEGTWHNDRMQGQGTIT
jgi:hypothetical protein